MSATQVFFLVAAATFAGVTLGVMAAYFFYNPNRRWWL